MTEGNHQAWKGGAVTNYADAMRPMERAEREVPLPSQQPGKPRVVRATVS